MWRNALYAVIGPPGEGSPTPVGVSSGPPPVRAPDRGAGRIRSRHTFEELRRSGVRGRSGPLTVSFVRHPEWPGPELLEGVARTDPPDTTIRGTDGRGPAA